VLVIRQRLSALSRPTAPQYRHRFGRAGRRRITLLSPAAMNTAGHLFPRVHGCKRHAMPAFSGRPQPGWTFEFSPAELAQRRAAAAEGAEAGGGGGLSAMDLVLHPGQTLYIPPYWSHRVESLDDASVAVSAWWPADEEKELIELMRAQTLPWWRQTGAEPVAAGGAEGRGSGAVKQAGGGGGGGGYELLRTRPPPDATRVGGGGGGGKEEEEEVVALPKLVAALRCALVEVAWDPRRRPVVTGIYLCRTLPWSSAAGCDIAAAQASPGGRGGRTEPERAAAPALPTVLRQLDPRRPAAGARLCAAAAAGCYFTCFTCRAPLPPPPPPTGAPCTHCLKHGDPMHAHK
jgi:hypothetical protein